MADEDDVDRILEKLTAAVGNTSEMMSRLLAANEGHAREARHAAEVSENLREEIRGVKRSLEKIVHVLHEGNGQKPLISRVDILETKMNTILDDKLVELAQALKDKSKNEDDKKLANVSANITGSWAFKGALLAAFVAIITTLLAKWF